MFTFFLIKFFLVPLFNQSFFLIYKKLVFNLLLQINLYTMKYLGIPNTLNLGAPKILIGH